MEKKYKVEAIFSIPITAYFNDDSVNDLNDQARKAAEESLSVEAGLISNLTLNKFELDFMKKIKISK